MSPHSRHFDQYTTVKTLPRSLCSLERHDPKNGPKWLEMALNHLFEHPNRSRNSFGENHLWPLWDPQVAP